MSSQRCLTTLSARRSRVFSLVPALSFTDGIDIARRQATSKSLDDIILKFPPVKTRREKWETSGENSRSILRRHVE